MISKKFVLKNLDCPSCAAKIEDKVSQIPGVQSASVNFLTTKMTLNFDENKQDEILATAQDIISKIEPETIIER